MEPKTTYKSALTMDQAKLTQHKSAVEITHHHDVPAATESLEIISHDEDETVTAAAHSLEIISHDEDETVTAAAADSLEIISHDEDETVTAAAADSLEIISHDEDETVAAAADSLEIVSHDETVTAPADSLEIISHGTTTANYWPIAQYSQGENFSLFSSSIATLQIAPAPTYPSPSACTTMVWKGQRSLVMEEEQQHEADLETKIIPDEIIHKILSLLPILSLCRFLTLSKYWMRVIKKLFFTFHMQEAPLPLQVQPLTTDRFPIFLSVGVTPLRNFSFDIILNRWDSFTVACTPELPAEAILPVASAGGLICYTSWLHPGYYWISNPVTGFSELVTPDRRGPCLWGMGRLHELIVHEHSPFTYTLIVVGVFQYPTPHSRSPLDGYGTLVYTSTTGRWETVRGPHLQRYLGHRPIVRQGRYASHNNNIAIIEYGPRLRSVVCGQYFMVIADRDEHIHTFDWRVCAWRTDFKPDLTRDLCAPQLDTYLRRPVKLESIARDTITISQLGVEHVLTRRIRFVWIHIVTLTDPRFECFYTHMQYWASYSLGGGSGGAAPPHHDWQPDSTFSCFVHGERIFVVGRNGRNIGYYHLVEKKWTWMPPFPGSYGLLPGEHQVEVQGFPFSPSFTRKVGVLRRREPINTNQAPLLLRRTSITLH